MKQIVSIILVFSLLCIGSLVVAEGQRGPGGRGGQGGMRGGAGGAVDKSSDVELQAMITDVAPKFQLLTYEDSETGTSLQYQLYIPENYDESQKYPLLVYIPDSTGAGKTASEIVEEYYGATVWVTDEDQAKHASFVLVPAFSETVVNDNWDVSEEVKVDTLPMLQSS